MRIVYLAAGAAGMYCGSCLHDNTLAAALLAAGHDVLLVPTYTPTRTDEPNVSIGRLFYGGINVYLQQISPIFRRTPWFFDRLLDWPWLVDRLSRRAASTQAESLGALTVSMLRGEQGNQQKELEKLIEWLIDEARPDVVHLSNSMLLGMARWIMARVPAPVVCSLSGEDIFLEKLTPPHYGQARSLLRERAREIAGFVALNRYYAGFMAEYLDVPPERIEVIRHGLNLDGYGAPPQHNAEPPVIGYFARICHEKGLHNLVEACGELAHRGEVGPFRLEAAGYLGAGDRPYLDEVTRRAAKLGLADRFVYRGELSRDEKIRFLQSMALCSVPTEYHESKGISILEALASGVPVVQPAHGVFPEVVEDTGGGVVYDPSRPHALADTLAALLADPARRARLGHAGQAAIRERYTAPQMAEVTAAYYERLLAR